MLSLFLSRVWLKLMLFRLLNHYWWLFLSLFFTSMTACLRNGRSFIFIMLLVAYELLLFNPSISQAMRLVICSLRPFVPQIGRESYRFICVPVLVSILFIICIVTFVFIVVIWLRYVMDNLNFCVCWWWHVWVVYQFKILSGQLLLMSFILWTLFSHIKHVVLILKHDLIFIFLITVEILILKWPLYVL